MIRKSAKRFSEKIMLIQTSHSAMTFRRISSRYGRVPVSDSKTATAILAWATFFAVNESLTLDKPANLDSNRNDSR
jgi:hypothetical protein